MFSASSLSGKQIWHIIAPSDISLGSITEVALDAIQKRAPVLNRKGTDYVFIEEFNRESVTAVLPTRQGYEPVPQEVTKTLHLQQKVTLPNLSKKQADHATGSSAAADIAQPAVDVVKPQPKGLRMRYKPAGFGHGDPGLGSDSEPEGGQEATTKTKFQFPKTLGGHGVSEKTTDGMDASQAKKAKKKKRQGSDVEMKDAPTTTTPKSQAKQAKEDKAKDVVNGTGELDKEERKKRKAEKKARKEDKAAAGTS
jgi:hypothetical protein